MALLSTVDDFLKRTAWITRMESRTEWDKDRNTVKEETQEEGGEGGERRAGDLIVEVFGLYNQPVDFLAALQHLKTKDVTAQ
jgi:hypothetical protein